MQPFQKLSGNDGVDFGGTSASSRRSRRQAPGVFHIRRDISSWTIVQKRRPLAVRVVSDASFGQTAFEATSEPSAFELRRRSKQEARVR